MRSLARLTLCLSGLCCIGVGLALCAAADGEEGRKVRTSLFGDRRWWR